MGETFADFPTRRNSLNFIRLVLAVLVIVSHSWPIGRFGPDPEIGSLPLGSFAVAGFFGLSGWLITRSRLTKPALSYSWHRFCRIYPGYLVALLVTAFAFAPLGAAVIHGDYRLRDGLSFVVQNSALSERQWTIPGTLPGWAFPAWNGSLWTLIHEVACYVVVGLLVSILGPRRIVLSSTLALVTLTAAAVLAPVLQPRLPDPVIMWDFARLAPFFFAGSVLYALRERIPLRWQLALLSAIITVGIAWARLSPTLAALPVAYGLLWVGARLPDVFQKVGRRNDISYGMYIYAFPTQQLLVLTGAASLGVVAYVCLGVLATIPLAALSWFVIERPAQRWRHVFAKNRKAAKQAPSDPPTESLLAMESPVRQDD